jgi:hypothetical protein
MYISGKNTPQTPWKIPLNFPSNVLAEEHRERLVEFIK